MENEMENPVLFLTKKKKIKTHRIIAKMSDYTDFSCLLTLRLHKAALHIIQND